MSPSGFPVSIPHLPLRYLKAMSLSICDENMVKTGR